ncbi:MAG TPA: hypothetical protein VH593_29215 [Ktedonobacteraceae bacterium]|jgi:hypothetical protein
MNEWYKNPVFLIGGAAAIFVAVILLRNQNATPSTSTQPTATTGQFGVPTNNLTQSTTSQGLNPVGGSYSYLDGTGMQHIIATDPYGNLVGYSNLPPGTSQPQPNELSSYIGSMSGQYLVQPWGSTTPIYATNNTSTST